MDGVSLADCVNCSIIIGVYETFGAASIAQPGLKRKSGES